MGLIGAIAAAAVGTVTIDGLEFQIRRVRSAYLAVAGSAQLLAMLSSQDMATVQEVSVSEAQQLLLDRFKSLSDVQLTKMSNSQDAMVCAGVVAIRATGSDEWEAVTISSSKPTNDEAGILSVRELPDGHRKRLSEEIMAHSTDQGGLQQSLDNFRS